MTESSRVGRADTRVARTTRSSLAYSHTSDIVRGIEAARVASQAYVAEQLGGLE